VNVDPAVQRRLLDLAEVDAELNRITHRRRTLPELAEITEGEAQLRVKQDALVAQQTTLDDLNRDAKRQEDEIDGVRAREDRDRNLLNGGSVAARQVTDLQHELETLARRQSALEDDLLELMERREAVELDVARAGAEVDQAKARLAELGQRRDTALEELETAEARRTADRATLVGQFPAELISLYEEIRAQKGTAAALLRARRCGACRLELDRTAMGRIKAAAADEVVRCEECGAILIRTGESGL
jgi:predicted  nucleic acid-binding Zn-ribbon protein